MTYKLYANLKNSKIIFEPNALNGLTNATFHEKIATTNKNVICKCLRHSRQKSEIKTIEKFYNKKIWLVRDPRDRIISAFLYRWYYKHKRSAQKFNETLDTVLAKEKAPTTIPFYKIIECSFNLNAYIKEEQRIIEDLLNCVKSIQNSWTILKYEDFITGNLADLENYLAFDLIKRPKNNFSLNRVKRTTTINNWKNWFTPADVDLFKPIFQPVLDFLNYPPDWELNENQIITKQEASQYLIKINKPERWFDLLFQKLSFVLRG